MRKANVIDYYEWYSQGLPKLATPAQKTAFLRTAFPLALYTIKGLGWGRR